MIRLSDCVSPGFQIVPRYRTRIVDLDSGLDQHNVGRTRAKRRFSAAFNFLEPEFHVVLSVFHIVKGSGYPFLIRDWGDYKAEGESLGAAAAADSAPLQLTKTYTVGAESVVRNITKPRSEGFTLYEGGLPKAGSLDVLTGLFTPSSPWTIGAAREWYGTHDVKVFFVGDELPTTIVGRTPSGGQLIAISAELEEDLRV